MLRIDNQQNEEYRFVTAGDAITTKKKQDVFSTTTKVKGRIYCRWNDFLKWTANRLRAIYLSIPAMR